MAVILGDFLLKTGDLFPIAAYLFGALLWLETRKGKLEMLDNNISGLVGGSMLWGLSLFMSTISDFSAYKASLELLSRFVLLCGAAMVYLAVRRTSKDYEPARKVKRK